MDAYIEFMQTGRLGARGADLLYDVTERVVHTEHVRPFDGGQEWDDDALQTLAHDFAADDRTQQRLITIRLSAVDVDSMARLLYKAIHNYIIDRLRTTDEGAFHRKVRDVLADEPTLESRPTPAGEAWVLPTTPQGAPWTGHPRELDGAAWSADVRLLRWNSDYRRDPIERESLVRVCTAVIEEAQCPVSTQTLVQVGMRRFALGTSPDIIDLDDVVAVDVDVAAEVADLDAVRFVVGQLTKDELTLLAHPDATARETGTLLGLGHSAAAARRQRFNDRMRAIIGTDPEAEAVARGAMRSARVWYENRTAGDGASFDQSERS